MRKMLLVREMSRAESTGESSRGTIQHLRRSQRTVFARQVSIAAHRTTCLRRYTDQGRLKS